MGTKKKRACRRDWTEEGCGVLTVLGPCSSTAVRVVVVHDIKEEESVRKQEEQEDERDEEGDEVNGEVEKGHSTCACNMRMTMK